MSRVFSCSFLFTQCDEAVWVLASSFGYFLVLGPVSLPLEFGRVSSWDGSLFHLANLLPVSVEENVHQRWTDQPTIEHKDGPEVVGCGLGCIHFPLHADDANKCGDQHWHVVDHDDVDKGTPKHKLLHVHLESLSEH